MPPWTRYLAPFAVGIAVGVALHKYWPKIKEVGGPTVKKLVREGSTLVEKGREQLWEQSEKFSDLVAEIREEEAAEKVPATPPPAET